MGGEEQEEEVAQAQDEQPSMQPQQDEANLSGEEETDPVLQLRYRTSAPPEEKDYLLISKICYHS